MTDLYDNPWQTVSSTSVYSNPWISVREDKVINPSGGDGIYGVVHFKNLAIGIIPVDHEEHTWLVGQYRYALEEYSWEVPMGGSPHNDDPLNGAKRELREETGLSAAKWQQLMKIHPSNSVSDETGYIYVASDLTPGETEHEDTEQLLIKRLPLIDAVTMALDGEITDCMTVAGLLKLHVAMQSGRITL
ncbi:DNA mismatch repair protein MutT [Chromatiales bacterium (ex Bugula neritina AB1)]|nr:DNA mismatch repair protein MutT [Chromatiales bacterium (ex Bugula neritina AB1)]